MVFTIIAQSFTLVFSVSSPTQAVTLASYLSLSSTWDPWCSVKSDKSIVSVIITSSTGVHPVNTSVIMVVIPIVNLKTLFYELTFNTQLVTQLQ